ncbi:MAG: hypothetical protein CMJ62_14570 [Planctomycetaceae bacterium]|nr:hypothetical protein [Planctomycetaceae bacterium]
MFYHPADRYRRTGPCLQGRQKNTDAFGPTGVGRESRFEVAWPGSPATEGRNDRLAEHFPRRVRPRGHR